MGSKISTKSQMVPSGNWPDMFDPARLPVHLIMLKCALKTLTELRCFAKLGIGDFPMERATIVTENEELGPEMGGGSLASAGDPRHAHGLNVTK